MSRQTVVTLVAMPGGGKTALMRAMDAGDETLVQVPFLREVMAAGFGYFDEPQRQRIVAGEIGVDVAIAEAIGDKPYLVNDNMFSVACVDVLADYDQVIVVLVARPWLTQARVDLRYAHCPDPGEEKLGQGCTFDETLLLEHVQEYGLPLCFVDASDLPYREVEECEAQAIASEEPCPIPVIPAGPLLYQQAIVVNGNVVGQAHEQGPEWEQIRREALLAPYSDMTGKTVLDIGAAEGNFCWEMLRRGAAYAVGVENAGPRTLLMRELRDAFRLPMSAHLLNVGQDTLPTLMAHETPLRYDVALLLNVLHHFAEPGPVLQKVLAVCEECVIESPFGIGAEPYRPGLPPIEHSMALPPLWVERQAQAAGFRLRAIENSPMYEGQRLIYRLERER